MEKNTELQATTYTTKAYAKLNLFLHIIGKDSNNYHQLESLIAFVDLYDILEFRPASKLYLEINGTFSTNLSNYKDNLVFKVVDFFRNKFRRSFNYNIKLTKNIPIGAGLGGGSSDAAQTILVLNSLLNLNLSKVELLNIAKNFGTDVPMCLYGKSCFAEGIGEILTEVILPKNLFLLLINPLIHVATPLVFKNFIHNFSNPLRNIPVFNNKSSFITYLLAQHNDLYPVATIIAPQITKILTTLNQTSSTISRMSGSGSTCFAIYETSAELELAHSYLQKLFPDYFIVSSKIL